MTRLLMFAAAAVMAGSLAVSALGSAAATTLKGTVGPLFTISLKSASGAKLKTLKAGTYTIVVADKSKLHNFHLTGPGVNKVITSTPFVGTKSYTAKLKAGKYTYVCDPHAAAMHGSFTVK